MADYIYLLESRLTQAQREALSRIRNVARAHGLTVFLVGGAVRDLTSGVAIRDLDVVVQGNALKLKKDLEKAGGKSSGTNDSFQSCSRTFPGGVRTEIGCTLRSPIPSPAVRPPGPPTSWMTCAAATLPPTPWPSPSTRAPMAS